MIRAVFYAITLVIMSASGIAQANASEEVSPHTLMASHAHDFHSAILGEDVTITVGLPFGYKPESATYPMVFHTDGDVMFAMGTEILRLMSFEGSAPQVISVSVSYGGFAQWLSARQRDYHPSASDPEAEGAAKFLRFLEQELVPFMHEHYALSEGGHTIYGHSSGGLFALYAGLTKPALFDRVFASSPSIEEEQEWIRGLLEDYDADALPRLYISLGGAETKTRDCWMPRLKSFSKSRRPRQSSMRYSPTRLIWR